MYLDILKSPIAKIELWSFLKITTLLISNNVI